MSILSLPQLYLWGIYILLLPFSSGLTTQPRPAERMNQARAIDDDLSTTRQQTRPPLSTTVSTTHSIRRLHDDQIEWDPSEIRSTINSIATKDDSAIDKDLVTKNCRDNAENVAKANILLQPLEGDIALGTIKFNFNGVMKGEPGVFGPRGPHGRQGIIGKPGTKGEKGESGVMDTTPGPMTIQFRHVTEQCTGESAGTVRLNENGDALELCSSNRWFVLGNTFQRDSTPPKSCLDALLRGSDRTNGMYWINAKPSKNNEFSSRVYCDMTTSGGGWTLIAKITQNFAWVCPEKDGDACTGSHVDPRHANLFHKLHERDVVDLVEEHGRDSATHLRNSLIREIFSAGRRQIRFTFTSSDGDGWEPSDDAYASFRHTDDTSRIFADDTWAMYSRTDGDFSWNVIKHERAEKSFSGDVICWGNTDDINYRYYEGGLHMGLPAEDGKPCHLLQDNDAIMLKSHYARMGAGQPTWAKNPCGLLGSEMFVVISSRVAIWVR